MSCQISIIIYTSSSDNLVFIHLDKTAMFSDRAGRKTCCNIFNFNYHRYEDSMAKGISRWQHCIGLQWARCWSFRTHLELHWTVQTLDLKAALHEELQQLYLSRVRIFTGSIRKSFQVVTWSRGKYTCYWRQTLILFTDHICH